MRPGKPVSAVGALIGLTAAVCVAGGVAATKEGDLAAGAAKPTQKVSKVAEIKWIPPSSLGQRHQAEVPDTLDRAERARVAVNALIGTPITSPSFGIAFVAGIGKHQWKIEDTEIYNRVGYNLGLDLSLGLGSMPLSVNLSRNCLLTNSRL